MRWKPSRRRGTLRRERDENHRRLAPYSLGPRPAELLYRQIGAAAQSRATHPWSRPVCERRDATAHGTRGLRPLAPCPRAHHGDRDGGGEDLAGVIAVVTGLELAKVITPWVGVLTHL